MFNKLFCQTICSFYDVTRCGRQIRIFKMAAIRSGEVTEKVVVLKTHSKITFMNV